MKKIKNKIKILVILAITICTALFIYEIFFSMENVIVKEVVIENKNISKNLNNFKIGIISDIKYQKFMNAERLSIMIDKLNDQDVNVVLFLGDLFHDNKQNYNNIDELINILKKINAKDGKFYVYGDQDNQEVVANIMDTANFELLENKITLITKQNSSFQLIGLNIKNDTTILDSSSSDMFTLVMSHIPFPITSNNVDYIISGHTLGNQINIPFIYSNKKASYNLGEYNINSNTKLYVNGGLGTVDYDIRLFSPPEITVIKLKNAGN